MFIKLVTKFPFDFVEVQLGRVFKRTGTLFFLWKTTFHCEEKMKFYLRIESTFFFQNRLYDAQTQKNEVKRRQIIALWAKIRMSGTEIKAQGGISKK